MLYVCARVCVCVPLTTWRSVILLHKVSLSGLGDMQENGLIAVT